MTNARNEIAVGAGYRTSALHIKFDRLQSLRVNEFLVRAPDPVSDNFKAHRLVARLIRNTDAAADIDEFEINTDLLVDFSSELKKNFSSIDDVISVQFVGGDHRVKTKTRNARRLHLGITVEKLLARKTVLRLFGLADDGVSALERTGIVATAENTLRKSRIEIRKIGTRGEEIIPMGDIIEIDYRPELPRTAEFLGGSVVGREHYRLARVADALGKFEFGHGRAVGSEIKLLQKLHQIRIGRGLHREILTKTRVP